MKYLVAISCVLLPVACTTVDPGTGEGKTSNATTGAGLGASGR